MSSTHSNVTDSGVPIDPFLITSFSAEFRGEVAIVVRAATTRRPVRCDRIGDTASAFRIDRQRLFNHHVDTSIKCPHDQVGVGEVG